MNGGFLSFFSNGFHKSILKVEPGEYLLRDAYVVCTTFRDAVGKLIASTQFRDG